MPQSSAPGSDSTRRIYFGREAGWLDTPCKAREQLPSGVELTGPLAIDQPDSTTVLWPGQRAQVDPHGNLIIRLR